MIIVRRSDERGHADHGWLDAYHTFSFADFRDPAWDRFGPLRVLNQDRVLPGEGFGTHGHDNMEIVTYVLEGALKFWVGSEDAEPIVVRTGEVLVLPSNVPHKAEALEDTLDVDIFSPPRQDWLDGTDDYLRQQ